MVVFEWSVLLLLLFNSLVVLVHESFKTTRKYVGHPAGETDFETQTSKLP